MCVDPKDERRKRREDPASILHEGLVVRKATRSKDILKIQLLARPLKSSSANKRMSESKTTRHKNNPLKLTR
jgi:hypothetical protein